MKKLLAALLAVSCFGCAWTEQVATDYMVSAADEINKTAFEGKLQYKLCYCDRNKDVKCWRHHGLYSPASKLIHIAPEWYWEPYWYFQGVIAHELIHAYLDQTHQEASESHPHSWRFRQERERVAQAIDIPEWAIPDGKKSGDKLDATRMMAYLERWEQAERNRVHGIITANVTSGGWPTELYDPEDWRDEPPVKK
jgi:hypothetical protein